MLEILDAIGAERMRQVSVEGWSTDHDDKHKQGEMAAAAACYALGSVTFATQKMQNIFIEVYWPWARNWWKPKDKKRDLIRAAALIVAELQRMERAENPAPDEPVVEFHNVRVLPCQENDQPKLRDEFNLNCPVGNKVIHVTGRGRVTLTVKTAAWMDSGQAVYAAHELAGMLMVSNVVGWQK